MGNGQQNFQYAPQDLRWNSPKILVSILSILLQTQGLIIIRTRAVTIGKVFMKWNL